MLNGNKHGQLSKKINEAIFGSGLSVSSMLTPNSSFGACIGTTVAQPAAQTGGEKVKSVKVADI